MDDLTNAPSNGADGTSTPAETQVSSAPDKAPSTRDAIDKAFSSVFEEAPAQRSRDEAGRFAAKQQESATEATGDAQPATETPQIGAPPSRFAKAAQDAWGQTPEPVRKEAERAISELTQGLEKYKTEAAAFEPVRKFDEMARQSGTTLDQALERYVGMENALRQDFVSGLALICKNYGVDPRTVAERLAGVQQRGGESPEVATLKAEIAELKKNIGGVSQTLSERDAIARVEKFAATAPEFEAVADTVAKLLQTGYATTLENAYETAVRLNPEVAARIEASKAAKEAETTPQKQDQPAAHTRKAGLSVTGSPSGSNPGTRKPAGSTRDALDRAFSQLGI